MRPRITYEHRISPLPTPFPTTRPHIPSVSPSFASAFLLVAVRTEQLEGVQRAASRRQSLYEHDRASLVKQMHGVHTQLGEAQAAMLRLNNELHEVLLI